MELAARLLVFAGEIISAFSVAAYHYFLEELKK